MQSGGCFDHAVWDGGYLGQFAMTMYVLEIKLVFFMCLYFIQDQ